MNEKDRTSTVDAGGNFDPKVINRIRALRELMRLDDKGKSVSGASDNEVAAAAKALSKILDREGITLEQLDAFLKKAEPVRTCELQMNCNNKLERSLAFQVVAFILGSHAMAKRCFRTFSKQRMYFRLTEDEVAEASELYLMFRSKFRKQVDLLFTAFLHKSELLDVPDQPTATEKGTSMSEADYKAFVSMFKAMSDVRAPLPKGRRLEQRVRQEAEADVEGVY